MTNLQTSAQFSKRFMSPYVALDVLLCDLMSPYVISQFNKVCYDQLTN